MKGFLVGEVIQSQLFDLKYELTGLSGVNVSIDEDMEPNAQLRVDLALS